MMNPLHPISGEPLFYIPSSNNHINPIQTTPENQILHDPLTDASQMGKGKQKKQLESVWEREEDYKVTIIDEDKKLMHREIERQRRQEMNKLCVTLRSLLPLEYVKGKRSTSDHMNEAVNYIKELENKLKELQAKKDELMKLSNLSSTVGTHHENNESFTTHNLPPYVIVHPLKGGVEIMCSYSFRNNVFPLSRVLDMLLQEGLNVVTCTSAGKGGRFIHSIQSEDLHMTGIDCSELQRKLTEAISSSTSSLQETLPEPENC